MKLSFLLFVFLLLRWSPHARNLEIPQKEFTLSLSQAAVELSSGETKKVEIRILKLKPYSKKQSPDGIVFFYNEELLSSRKVNI